MSPLEENPKQVYFQRHEFACPCGCGFDAQDKELDVALTDIRVWSGDEIYVKCNRCKPHNERIRLCFNHGEFYGNICPECGLPGSQRSSKTSYHMDGMAADIKAKNKTPGEVYAYLCAKYPGKYGIILYTWGVHLDMRKVPLRKENV